MVSLVPTQHEGVFGDVVRRDAASPRTRVERTPPRDPELGKGAALQLTFGVQGTVGIGTAATMGGEGGALLADTKAGYDVLTTTSSPSAPGSPLPNFGVGFGLGASAGYTLNITLHRNSSAVPGDSSNAADLASAWQVGERGWAAVSTGGGLKLEAGLAFVGGSVGIGNGSIQSVTLSLGPQIGIFVGALPQVQRVRP
jgi:hypothetical protein